MRQYVVLPTFVPKWGPYNHMPDINGNPPTLNLNYWHATGPQSAIVERTCPFRRVAAFV